MKRWQADVLLGLAGLIWGFGFVAQKDALSSIGPATFIAAKFLLSALCVLPFVWREIQKSGVAYLRSGHRNKRQIFSLCLVFTGAVLTQQYGMLATTVTKTAFLTGLYIVMVPFAAFLLYRLPLTIVVVIACLISFLGTALLTGSGVSDIMSGFTRGDGLVLVCAFCLALQVPMMGKIVSAVRAPFALSFLQYVSAGIVALLLAVIFEPIDLHAICAAWIPIVYSGILSAGVAFTLQAIAQQHTPATDSALLMSTETLFGALGGAWLMQDRLTMSGYIGCALILLSIILVELIPYLQTRSQRS